MKTRHRKSGNAGLTLIEILVIVVILAMLFPILFPSRHRSFKAKRIMCVNNLKEIETAFRLHATENENRYPMSFSTNDKSWKHDTAVHDYFKMMTNELIKPKVLICPGDERIVAIGFSNLNSSNISYFIGVDATITNTNMLLAGDRNITNGFLPKNGILELTTNQMVGFTDEIHLRQGNIALADGSVQQVSSARLRSEIIVNTGFATNRILLP